MSILNWELNKEKILAKLQSPATLKLCVKLLNEPLLIEGWIQHHAKIVGFENLIIADNGSTDPYSLDIYRRYNDKITIFQFDGPHNQIHWHSRFSELFKTIQETSQYFSFIDADERLVWLNATSWIADTSIVEALAKHPVEGIIPTTWLINRLNHFETFSFLDSEFRPFLSNNLRWGKPILPSALAGIQDGIHNAQFDRFWFSSKFGVRFFLLHLTQFPERRISTNRNKLISRGIVDKKLTSREIVQSNFDDYPDKSFMPFIAEMRRMFQVLDGEFVSSNADTDDEVILETGGTLGFKNEHSAAVLGDFLDEGVKTIKKMFLVADDPEASIRKPQSILQTAIAQRNLGNTPEADRLFRGGMALYPEFLDQYGGPAFRKELMRTYLAKEEWQKAEELIPSAHCTGSAHWHCILFARAHARVENFSIALKWWKQVLKHEPNNGEATTYIANHSLQDQNHGLSVDPASQHFTSQR